MTSAIAVHDFRFLNGGPALSFSLKPGQLMAVLGPASSGKTRFIRSLCGLERGYKGSVRLGCEVALAGYPEPTRRQTPESLARKVAGKSGASRVAEALGATALWDERRTAFAQLSPTHRQAAELIQALASPAKLLLIDGHLDALDLWTQHSAVELLSHRLAEGAAAIVVTHSPILAVKSDMCVIWKRNLLSYAGSMGDLARQKGWTHLEIETLDNIASRALCDPFEVRVQEEDGRLSMSAKEGQTLASRMLVEGYGDVRLVIQRPPSLEELLSGL